MNDVTPPSKTGIIWRYAVMNGRPTPSSKIVIPPQHKADILRRHLVDWGIRRVVAAAAVQHVRQHSRMRPAGREEKGYAGVDEIGLGLGLI